MSHADKTLEKIRILRQNISSTPITDVDNIASAGLLLTKELGKLDDALTEGRYAIPTSWDKSENPPAPKLGFFQRLFSL